MMDDHDRARRLQAEPRTDIAMGHRVQRFVEALQQRICGRLESLDGDATFGADRWERPGGGGGLARVMEDGTVFEKAGVNTSAVHGMLPDVVADSFGVAPKPFFATGISLVIHPQNPHVPTVHANFRYFALGDVLQPDEQWFGGGADLTPVYPTLEDAQHFHSVWKTVCDAHDVADYANFKTQCDTYFYLPHRKETRGVGGIFFDHLRDRPEETFHFVREAGRAFLSAYEPIVRRRKDTPFGARERDFQLVRRGRYVEFNLIHDRGTKFGLQTDGRVESILMSLPRLARWSYDWQPEPGSPEAAALAYFHPYDWLGATTPPVAQMSPAQDAPHEEP